MGSSRRKCQKMKKLLSNIFKFIDNIKWYVIINLTNETCITGTSIHILQKVIGFMSVLIVICEFLQRYN
ncbi:hypothetical protein KGI01_21510 [Kurthia gibsonii]|nr:hypothetical protein KGI01_21510 [Kurthia gibsonii]